ncbi:uncharacterized protein LOC141527459 [Cotesia typhae]|uniref:uncharacterized protein LOC141527459 n=1 Tax=Cotesia typhae TaxID=2053667 RepID=UPI003D680CF7
MSAVEKENKWHQESDNNFNLLKSTSRDDFLKPGPTKDRIAKECNIFFPKSAIAYIEKRTESPVSSHLSDWKNLVKEALITVYGSNMGSYCATGKRHHGHRYIPNYIRQFLLGLIVGLKQQLTKLSLRIT